ncbi:polyribonucleotide nucleotidyltransferase [Candidatus Shapirobacteria bacterium CG10_big_fil_rev_8_21_14_0_10_40_9]|uniref:Polyribonucleotide nucleotidyltransferase n=1 Tax=Candidatus Shapirobacteria bacterium CG10_big_fil_rev_8_21_14_0_10_40_9 TaxID=1974888 RepID=A0A2M8L4H3_9BACT|nr:MAG: polyribonucleotide nucleotidyltransferase [Candidatus Shapirobacteria bacterium CG10_big_fil_rev_8_21_14_0_10_40_9]
MKKISKSIEIGGRTLTLETGGIAYQAQSAVLARYGDTEVLAAVCSGAKREDLDYLPLDIEYVERLYAGGRIKGSRWVKREGRPSDEAILIGRLIDRSLRPLFPKEYLNEIQITIIVLSVDLENNPDALSVIAASAALAISDIPWEGPVGTVRVGLKDGKCFVNPINGELEFSDLDLVVSSTSDEVVMIESSAKQVPEEKFLEAINFGKKEDSKIIDLISSLVKEKGVKKQEIEKEEKTPEVRKKIEKEIRKNLDLIFSDKIESFEVKQAILAEVEEGEKKEAGKAFDEIFKSLVRERTLSGKRTDGRKPDEIRPIEIEVGLLPRTHGSALFSRGQTQVLTVTTLGSPSLEQLIESPEGEETKRFIHHYSMPPYSMGEVGRMTGPSRREIGHGALVEKALEPAVPLIEKFPYTIRLVSEVLSSNGSTSMASVCGSTLSLMDAGVPISEPVAGIAMGLIVKNDEKFVILTDITGTEDFNGDMDFKIAGTKNGITAVQLDIKISGLEEKLIKETLSRARQARLEILEKITKVLAKPREKLSQYAPRVAVLHLDTEKIGEVIGPGGKVIRRIIAETGATVDIEDDGTVNISGISEESVKKAVDLVNGLTREVRPGEIYEGVVKRIQPFGAFVEILPGKEGLVHVSQMSEGFVKDPAEVVSVDQKLKVKVIEIDEMKRINLSMLLDGVKKERQRLQPPRARPRFFRPHKPGW